MNQRICTFEGCAHLQKARGYCDGHYKQQRRGKPLTALRVKMTLSERMNLHTDRTGDCWLWTRPKNSDGYGQVRVDRKTSYAHRVAYALAFGPIPKGMEIDHTCHTPGCVRPEHLRIATRKQNGENRAGARSGSRAGVWGVSWSAAKGKWVAQVRHNRQNFYLGSFATIEEAGVAAHAKRLELFSHNDADRMELRIEKIV